MAGARLLADLADELELRFGEGTGTPWPAADLERLAMDAFRLQFEAIPVYRGFCEARGCTPATVSTWSEVPAVPATAFKHLDLCVTEAELVFRTSGTTGGEERRGRHLVPRVSLYRASLLPTFEAHLLAGVHPLRFLSLVPSPEESPDSSLSFMVGAAADAFASETHWLVDGAGSLAGEGLRGAVAAAVDGGEPVVVLATALAMAHALECLEADPVDPLPPGSRIMETGGFKGSGREIGRSELHQRVSAATGVPSERIVSEYGMTELLSQLYEPVLSEGLGARGWHLPPPWLKVRALDPTTLDEAREGEPGLLAFFDLANAGSVCHVLTEDLGVVVDGRVWLRGRVEGAEPRGCSRAMDELMSSADSAS